MVYLRNSSIMLLLLLLAVLTLANKTESERWISAHAVTHEFPYQVSLQLKGSHICGGALITMKHILTVAHCVFEQDEISGRMIRSELSDLEVVAGTVDKLNYNPRGQTRRVQSVRIHRQFSPHKNSMDHDIAIIEVIQEFFSSHEIMAIRIQDSTSSKTDICLSSGWGVTRINSIQPRYMTKVPFPIFDYENCKGRYGHKLTENMFCGGFENPNRHTCQGESGSPLVCNAKLTGLLSWGYGCVSVSNPMVFTNVTQYKDWIDHRSSSTAEIRSTAGLIIMYSVIGLLISYHSILCSVKNI